MSENPPAATSVFDQTSLQDVVAHITRQLDEGKRIDVDSCVARYPEHADELRELLPALRALVELGLTDDKGSHGLGEKESQTPIEGVLGDFRIVRELGRGGMGVVYEAEQISLKRRVALKVLPFGALLDKRQLERFHNEAKATARLKHPNLVSVHSVGCERAVHYYAMELVDGKSLSQVIEQLKISANKQRGLTDVSEADTRAIAQLSTEYSNSRQRYFCSVARLGVQAAEALHYAHHEGIIHRDIKPSNLLLDDSGKLWVADFGLAQIQTEHTLTVTGDLVGTIRYMSPEQAAGKKLLDHRADIYSLGITLYELLTLVPAFAANDHRLLLQQVTEQQPRRPRQLNAAIPTDLETVILKAIAKEPESRYESARDLAEDLKRFLEHKPIQARRVTRAEHLWRWAKRNPTMAGLGATLCSVLLFLSIAGPLVAIRQTSLATARAKSENELRLSQERLRLQLYQSELNSAYAYWHSYDLDTSYKLLERHRPKRGEEDLREFAWYYLWGLHQKVDNQPILKHSQSVYRIQFSPDGKSLATMCHDSVIRLWDIAQGTVIQELEHPGGVTSMAFSPDGQHLVSCGYSGHVFLWLLSDGKCLETLFEHPPGLHDVHFSSDGKLLAVSGFEGAVGIFDMSSREWIQFPQVNSELVWSCRFSPDGKRIISGGYDRIIRLWDVDTRSLVHECPTPKAPQTFVFGPDGETFAHDGFDDQITFVDIKTKQPQTTFKCRLAGHLANFAISPSGNVVATVCTDNTVRLWDSDAGDLLGTLVGHASTTTCVAFSRDGKMLATGSKNGAVRLWDESAVEGRSRLNTASQSQAWITSIAISSDQRTLATGCGPDVMRTARGNIRLWNLTTLQRLMVAKTPEEEEIAPIKSLAFSPEGQTFATGGGWPFSTGEIRLWDSKTGSLTKALAVDKGIVYSVAFSPDGNMLAIGRKKKPYDNNDKTVGLWDVATGRLRHEFETVSLDDREPYDSVSVEFSPDGAILAAGGGTWLSEWGDVRLWDVQSRVELGAFLVGGGYVKELAFSADGEMLAIAAKRGTVTLWDVKSQRIYRSFRSGFSAASLAISPDGKTLAVGSDTNDIRLWHMETGGQLGTLKVPHWVTSLGFAQDGRTLIAGCDNKTVWIWTIPSDDVSGGVSNVVVLDIDKDQKYDGHGAKTES